MNDSADFRCARCHVVALAFILFAGASTAVGVPLTLLDIQLSSSDISKPDLQRYVAEGSLSEDVAELVATIRPRADGHREEALRLCEQVNALHSLPYEVRRWVNLVPIYYGTSFPTKIRRGEAWLNQSRNDYRLDVKLRTYLATMVTQSGGAHMSAIEQMATVDRLMKPILEEAKKPQLDTVLAIMKYSILRGQCAVRVGSEWHNSDAYKNMDRKELQIQNYTWREETKARERQLLLTARQVLANVEANPEQTPGFVELPTAVQAEVLRATREEIAVMLEAIRRPSQRIRGRIFRLRRGRNQGLAGEIALRA